MEVRVLKAVPRPVLLVAPYKIRRCRKNVLLRVAGSNPARCENSDSSVGRAETPSGVCHVLLFTLLLISEKCRTNVLLRW